MAEKRALSFPLWVEALVIVGFCVMAGVEYAHGQWVWACIFGVCGSLFGGTLVGRLITGDKHGGE